MLSHLLEFGVLEPSASETKETEQKGMGGGGGTSFLPTTLEYSHHAPAETGAERTGAEERLPPEEAPHCAWRSCVMVWPSEEACTLCLVLLCDGLDPGLFPTHSTSCI